MAGGIGGAIQWAAGSKNESTVEGPDQGDYTYGGRGEKSFGDEAYGLGSRTGPIAGSVQADQQYGQIGTAQGFSNAALQGLQDAANGNDNSVAQMAMRQNTSDAVAQQMAAAASARGGPQAIAAAQHSAAQNAAAMQQQSGIQGAMLRAQEIANAKAAFAGAANNAVGSNINAYQAANSFGLGQAQLDLSSRNANDAMQMGLYGLGQNASRADQQGRQAYGAADQGAQQANANIAQANAQDANAWAKFAVGAAAGGMAAPALGAAAGGGGGGGNGNGDGTLSDARQKRDIEPIAPGTMSALERSGGVPSYLQDAPMRSFAPDDGQVSAGTLSALERSGGIPASFRTREREPAPADDFQISPGTLAALERSGGVPGRAREAVPPPQLSEGTSNALRRSEGSAAADAFRQSGAAYLPPSSPSDQMLSALEPVAYKYQPGSGEDPGQQRYGILAQDLERSPMGASIVRETPRGKEIDVGHGLTAALASLADLNRRLKGIETRGAY